MVYGRQWGVNLRITRTVKYLILINVFIFVIGLFFRDPRPIFRVFGLNGAAFWSGALWQVVTYMFLHGGPFHILVNMFILWMFGTPLESSWGPSAFIKYYMVCGLGAGLLHVVVLPGSSIPAVGASGAIYGLLLAFGILFPNRLIYIWGIIPIKAKFFVIGIGALDLIAALSSTQSGIAHFVHLGGLLFGLVYLKWDNWKRSYSYWRARKRYSRHLKAVSERSREKDSIQKNIDEILDKANRHGVGSLTPQERKMFTDYGRKINDIDSDA